MTRRRSQVVRQRSAKPLFSGSNPLAASNNSKGLAKSASPFIFHATFHVALAGETGKRVVANYINSLEEAAGKLLIKHFNVDYLCYPCNNLPVFLLKQI